MPFKITSVMALATLVGAAAAAASKPMTTNEDPAGARRLTDSFEDIGCYTDAASPRIMGLRQAWYSLMTTEYCAGFCSSAIPGSKFFGTQYSQECFCGDESTDFEYYGPSSNCTMPCPGDNATICGGVWAMSVYEYTGLPATPAPVPTLPPAGIAPTPEPIVEPPTGVPPVEPIEEPLEDDDSTDAATSDATDEAYN